MKNRETPLRLAGSLVGKNATIAALVTLAAEATATAATEAAPPTEATEATEAAEEREAKAKTTKAKAKAAKGEKLSSGCCVRRDTGMSALGKGTRGKYSQAQNQAQDGRNSDSAHVHHRSFLSLLLNKESIKSNDDTPSLQS